PLCGDDPSAGGNLGTLTRGRFPCRIVVGTISRTTTLGQAFRHAIGRGGSNFGIDWRSVGAQSSTRTVLIGPCGAGSGGAGLVIGVIVWDPKQFEEVQLGPAVEVLDSNFTSENWDQDPVSDMEPGGPLGELSECLNQAPLDYVEGSGSISSDDGEVL